MNEFIYFIFMVVILSFCSYRVYVTFKEENTTSIRIASIIFWSAIAFLSLWYLRL